MEGGVEGLVRLALVQAAPVAVGPAGTALGAEIDRT